MANGAASHQFTDVVLSEQVRELYCSLRNDLDGPPRIPPPQTGPVVIHRSSAGPKGCVCQAQGTAEAQAPSRALAAASRQQGLSLLQQLRSSPPPWAYPLQARLPRVPEALRRLVWDVALRGSVHAVHEHCTGEVLAPPAKVSQYISGSSSQVLRFSQTEIGSFLAALFHVLQLGSCTRVELAGWDLFHCHLFVHCHETDTGLECELGALFHSKEFPEEYRPSLHSPLYPISHPRQGGSKDPRIGTQVSCSDVDYHLRNYLWTMSTNRLFLLDPRSSTFDSRLLCRQGGSQFHTCSEEFFTSLPLGDINYFPGLYSNADLGPSHDDAKREADMIVDMLWTCQQGCAEKVLQLRLPEQLRWYAEQIGRLVGHSREHSLDLLFSPRSGVSTMMAVHSALCNGGMEAAAKCVEGLGKATTEELVGRIGALQKNSGSEQFACERMLETVAQSSVLELLSRRLTAINAQREAYNEKQKATLLSEGVSKEDAELALRQTSFDGLCSSYKSSQLLAVAFGRYRSDEDREEFGDRDYSWADAVLVHSRTFYTGCSLHALALMNMGAALEEAVAATEAARTAALEAMLQLKLREHDARVRAGLPPKSVSDPEGDRQLLRLRAPKCRPRASL